MYFKEKAKFAPVFLVALVLFLVACPTPKPMPTPIPPNPGGSSVHPITPPPPVVPPIPQADQTEPRTGVDAYQLVAFPIDQITAYLDALVANGGSVLRVFMDYTWPEQFQNTAGWMFSIFNQVGWWKDVGGTYDGKTFPLFTIGKTAEYGDPWNQAVVAKWKAIFQLCKERGIRVTVSVFDGCSMWTALAKRYQPQAQNLQHQGAEAPGTAGYTRMNGTTGQGLGQHTGGYFGGFPGAEVGGNMKSYLAAIIPFVAHLIMDSGVDYRIMPGNEYQLALSADTTQAEQDATLQAYFEYWIKTLEALGVPGNRIVLSIAGTHDRTRVTVPLVKTYGVIEQMHGPNSDVTLTKFLNEFPGVEMDGDGFDSAGAGYENENGYHMPSLAQCAAIRAILKAKGIHEFHIFNGHIEGPAWQDITKAEWTEQKALAGK